MNRIVLDKIPLKPFMASTLRVDSIKSKRNFILKLRHCTGKDDMLDIVTMTFDSKDIVNAIKDVKTMRSNIPIRLFVDASKINNYVWLEQLASIGVEIYRYNVGGAKRANVGPSLLHAKTILRRCGDKMLTIISTGNLTDAANDDINTDSYHSDNQELFDTIKNFNDDLMGKSERYVAGVPSQPSSSESSPPSVNSESQLEGPVVDMPAGEPSISDSQAPETLKRPAPESDEQEDPSKRHQSQGPFG